MYNFYDTSSLLLLDTIKKEDNIVISSITLQELENIKTSSHKDGELKYKARKLLHKIHANPELLEVWIFNESMLTPIEEKCLTVTDDMRILASAIDYDNKVHPDEVEFYTNDLCLFHIANLFFGNDSIKSIIEKPIEDYVGYKEVSMNEEEMSTFYMLPQSNIYNLLINEYMIIKNQKGQEVDCVKWTGERYSSIPFYSFSSKTFGNIKPKDNYQKLACDSLRNNQLTILEGKPGSGKSLLSMSYMLEQLESGEIDKIYIFCNPVAVRGAAKLGYYPGDKDTKLLDSVIGNFLSSKLGDMTYVERLIEQEQLILIPMADCRGIDIGTDSKAILYITEAQNMSVDLMKLALQRAGENCQVILDGDVEAQLDLSEYGGTNNGLRRTAEVFKGQNLFGKVTLKNVHRSKIAEIADNL